MSWLERETIVFKEEEENNLCRQPILPLCSSQPSKERSSELLTSVDEYIIQECEKRGEQKKGGWDAKAD